MTATAATPMAGGKLSLSGPHRAVIKTALVGRGGVRGVAVLPGTVRAGGTIVGDGCHIQVLQSRRTLNGLVISDLVVLCAQRADARIVQHRNK
jgi:hypothetical protein